MGSDAAASDGSIVLPQKEPKVFRNGDFLIGFCQSFRLGQILKYNFDPPRISNNPDFDFVMEFMVTEFVPALKQCFEDHEFPLHEEDKNAWSLLVGVYGYIFYIENDFHVECDTLSYAAIGAGANYAMGAFFAMPKEVAVVNKVEKALEAASTFSPLVIGPFEIISK
jgi:hypothetical protein